MKEKFGGYLFTNLNIGDRFLETLSTHQRWAIKFCRCPLISDRSKYADHIVLGSPFSILKAILKAVNLIIDFEINFKSGKFIYRFLNRFLKRF